MVRSNRDRWALPLVGSRRFHAARGGFTLIEMLVAMAITLVMMAAVVTLFANVSNSVRNRRATMEMNAQIRQVRNTLQEDLQGATCPGLTWQRPESNHGYIEIIEGPAREGEASTLIDANPNVSPPLNWPPTPANPEIDHKTSIIPSSDPNTTPFADSSWATDGAGLGDYDDVLMLTVRNEHKPFVGPAPSIPTSSTADNSYPNWTYESVESPLAEVVWFAVENPGYTTATLSDDPTANHFFGEPGMRTIYRRTLLIAPWLNPYKALDNDGDGIVQEGSGPKFKPVPGLLRLLPAGNFSETNVAAAIAALISFQDRYDISCRLEWDYGVKQWKIMANTLGDLTKRENRFGHYGFWLATTLPKSGSGVKEPGSTVDGRRFPFALESWGSGYSGAPSVQFVTDPDIPNASTSPGAKATGNVGTAGSITAGRILTYSVDPL
jgi:prepilin-type N-terminal cleavage/methylation domain-containing protein